ncbi:MAG: hypothetical protein JNK15_18530 [Planctomycetes bacterium]|nr:hypothetical protein [Planctomycetota bacterium]
MRLAAFVGVVFAAVAASPAQEFSLTVESGGRPACTVRGLACGGVNRPGGQGFARVEVQEVAGAEHDVRVTLSIVRWSNGDVRLARSFTLQPNERKVLFLPMPTRMPSPELRVDVDGNPRSIRLGLSGSDGACGLLIADRADAVPAGLQRLATMSNPSESPSQSLVASSAAPTDWRLYTGFDLVQVDGRAAVSGEVQDALRRAVFAGVTVLVTDPGALPAGPLQGRVQLGEAAYGLGRFIGVTGNASEALPARLFPIEPGLQLEAPIPGLGDAPVRVFLMVIVAFAIVAGPVNFLWLRRRRQPLLALVTVPVLGFGTTAAIIAFGVLHDGFGVRGVVHSWTWLDQGSHEAATWSTRTLFPGRAPAAFPVDADTLVVAPRATARPDGAGDRFHFDLDSTRLDGGVLPSRTATPLLTVQQGVVRQRLVVQRTGDGMQVLADGGVQPNGGIVLRDLAGGYWIGQGGHLTRADSGAVRAALEQIGVAVETVVRVETEERRWSRRGRQEETREVPTSIGTLGDRMVPRILAPGDYLALVQRPAWLADHGLQPAYDLELHVVRGRLAAEDVR